MPILDVVVNIIMRGIPMLSAPTHAHGSFWRQSAGFMSVLK